MPLLPKTGVFTADSLEHLTSALSSDNPFLHFFYVSFIVIFIVFLQAEAVLTALEPLLWSTCRLCFPLFSSLEASLYLSALRSVFMAAAAAAAVVLSSFALCICPPLWVTIYCPFARQPNSHLPLFLCLFASQCVSSLVCVSVWPHCALFFYADYHDYTAIYDHRWALAFSVGLCWATVDTLCSLQCCALFQNWLNNCHINTDCAGANYLYGSVGCCCFGCKRFTLNTDALTDWRRKKDRICFAHCHRPFLLLPIPYHFTGPLLGKWCFCTQLQFAWSVFSKWSAVSIGLVSFWLLYL